MSGRLFVIAAPSGAGKTSLVKAALAREPNLRVCVSHTTRARRANEVDGRDYHFVSVDQFKEMIAADGFLEYAPVFDNFYGTSRAALEEAFGRGHDVILEIDCRARGRCAKGCVTRRPASRDVSASSCYPPREPNSSGDCADAEPTVNR